MTNLREALQPYYLMPRDSSEFCGISRRYFPKWAGWKLVDENPFDRRLHKLVEDFYCQFFWCKLGLDQLEDQRLAELIFTFAITNGKRKATDKLCRVLKINKPTNVLEITKVINTKNSDVLFYELYAELVEFCVCMNKREYIDELCVVYRKYL